MGQGGPAEAVRRRTGRCDLPPLRYIMAMDLLQACVDRSWAHNPAQRSVHRCRIALAAELMERGAVLW